MDYKDLKSLIMSALENVKDKLPKDRYESVKELVLVGEEGIALENLCSNIDDFEIGIPEEAFLNVKAAAESMGLDKSSWEYIQEHIV